jgi:hypothetical protein
MSQIWQASVKLRLTVRTAGSVLLFLDATLWTMPSPASAAGAPRHST